VRHAVDASDVAPADDGWGSAVSEGRRSDGRGQDDVRAQGRRDG
jgi:hypothetical protein